MDARPGRFDEDELVEMFRQLIRGKNYHELAEEHDVSYTTARRAIMDVAQRVKHVGRATLKAWMRGQKLSAAKLARELGVSVSTMYGYTNRGNNIPPDIRRRWHSGPE